MNYLDISLEQIKWKQVSGNNILYKTKNIRQEVLQFPAQSVNRIDKINFLFQIVIFGDKMNAWKPLTHHNIL